MNACETSLSLMASKSKKIDPTLFTKIVAKDLFICQIYVDDIIFGSTNKSSCEELSRIMIQKFEMSMMGEFKYFLGFQIKQIQNGTFIGQTKYIQDILNKFGMKDGKPIKTPMETNGHLDLDTGGKSIDQKVYRSMIGSLLYLCASRLDIMLSVCMCARFQANPKEVHLRAVKRIMRYLVYTPKFGLWYPKGSTFDLIRYSDANWARCIERAHQGLVSFGKIPGVMGFKETKLRSSFHRRSRVHCRRPLLRAITLDEANP
jgi:hypothetical protein